MAITESIDARVAERHLLTHPFYRAWTAGTLPRTALFEYARQYYAFESRLPGLLKSLAKRVDGASAEALLANAWDEEHGAHPELWIRFGEALGLDRSQIVDSRPNASTQALVDTYVEATERAPAVGGVAAIYAYESQLPAVAEAKIAGLEAHYDFGARRAGLAFFEVHRTIDVQHAAAERRILETADDEESARAAAHWAERALDAWWNFLSAVYPAGDGVNLMSRTASLN
jgi:pyrroloquinoline-quinone synthase